MIKFLIHNKLAKFFYGILLLPLCYSLFLLLVFIFKNIKYFTGSVQYFFIGCLLYLLIHILLYKPIKLYVIGHELLHAISAYICGANIKKIKFCKNSGSINVDKVNTFIALSPYFFPFYSVVVILFWIIIKVLFRFNLSWEIFMFFLGFTLMFHLVLTVYAIFLGQQDLQISGWLFSIVLIFIVNCFILIVIFVTLFPLNVNFEVIKDYFFKLTSETYNITFLYVKEFFKFFIKEVKLLMSKIL